MSTRSYITPEKRQNIIDDLTLGKHWNTIALRHDVSYSTIRRIKKSFEGGCETMAEDKKIPETALSGETVSGSADSSDNRITTDTNIITDVPEVVKPDTLLNSAVDDAVLDRIEKLGFRIDELMKERKALEIERNTLIAYHEKFKEVQNNGT